MVLRPPKQRRLVDVDPRQDGAPTLEQLEQ
jgi:hypothetical protein